MFFHFVPDNDAHVFSLVNGIYLGLSLLGNFRTGADVHIIYLLYSEVLH